MTTLLLDMDGPLADFDRHFWKRCTERGYLFDVEHPDQQRHRFFTEHLPIRRERQQARAMVDQAGWFADLPVTPGAREGVAQLLDLGFDVWVCTKPLEANPTCLNDKQGWIEEHFPALAGRLIIAPDKSMVHGDVLLDDAPKPEWFPLASWRPVIFAAPFNYGDPAYSGLPIWSWGSLPSVLAA